MMEIMDTAELQTQLISMMETLAKTVVVETLQLFEKNSFLLRLEIARCTSENESLKKKCHFLESELQSARKTSGKMNGTKAPGLTDTGHRPAIDSVFGKEWCMNLWRQQESSVGEQEETHLEPAVIIGEPVKLLDEEPDLIMIKEETPKIDDFSGKSKPEADQSSSLRGPAMTSDESCVAPSSEDFITYMAASDDHVKLKQRLRKDNVLDGATATHGNSVMGLDLSTDVGFFPSKVKRNRKRVTDTQKKKIKCILCEKTFEFFSRLQKHMRTHSGEKPFVCTVCGRRFSQKPNLLLHERTHSGDRPYGCT